MKKILPIANGVALILTIAVNYISSTGLLNGSTMKTFSDKYFNYFTPAGYAFSIWGVIYLALLGFVVYTGRNFFNDNANKLQLENIGWWFVLSCFANSIWVVAWLNDYTGTSVIVMAVLLFSLIKIMINTRMELDAHPLKEYLFVFWPFAIYSGWVTVAFIANISAFLTKINWSGWGIADASWAIIMICIAGLVNVLMIYGRNLREYGLVGIWALVAISISNKSLHGYSPIVYSCYIVTAIIFVFIVVSSLKTGKRDIGKM